MRNLILAAALAAMPAAAFAAGPPHVESLPTQVQQPDFHAIALMQEARAATAEAEVLQLRKQIAALQKQLAAAKAPKDKPTAP